MSEQSVYMNDRQQGQPTLQFKKQVDRLGNIGGTLQDVWSDAPCDVDDDAAGVDEEGRCETSAEA
ncbi:uncharacterized protein PHACADRAFT_246303 [Phanerochaete carnosa HHB-10118-sp]|uniref:Uncharacterized protein n=1 Tax=Phanerochaete carnosa (strain HHB-10118-sp) TaxID=650164 RepID=K5XBR7_PHACS|nr:uncharacterized protein PHACADRAFT_246303 [Phanerochaete carnosa HHB-10118-sp]EKM60407.1 hypothetical protein PHACADRAFT_246303 [Phanerochaete carnosa HHB-10118-sp]